MIIVFQEMICKNWEMCDVNICHIYGWSRNTIIWLPQPLKQLMGMGKTEVNDGMGNNRNLEHCTMYENNVNIPLYVQQ